MSSQGHGPRKCSLSWEGKEQVRKLGHVQSHLSGANCTSWGHKTLEAASGGHEPGQRAEESELSDGTVCASVAPALSVAPPVWLGAKSVRTENGERGRERG